MNQQQEISGKLLVLIVVEEVVVVVALLLLLLLLLLNPLKTLVSTAAPLRLHSGVVMTKGTVFAMLVVSTLNFIRLTVL